MCDQTEVQYLPGEVVWVKLRALWWPGQVQDYDSLPEEITGSLRKRPLAVVKFFQEDTFEYVHKLDLIYHYNCSRKNEFIKKGLDLARKKTSDRPSNMDLFPSDVVRAEHLTNGDPGVINDDAFKPEEKPKYEALFGGEKKKFGRKKGKDESPVKMSPSWRGKSMGWRSRGKSPSVVKPAPDTPRTITHRRFIQKALDGTSDYESHIREQKRSASPSPLKEYQCVSCGFNTCRLNVIVLHFNSAHSLKSKEEPVIRPKAKARSVRTPTGKAKEESKVSETPEPSKTVSTCDETPISSGEDEEKKTPRVSKRKVKLDLTDGAEIKKPKVVATLLADWEEDAEQEQEEQEQHEERERDRQKKEEEDRTAPEVEPASASKSKEIFEFNEDDGIDFDISQNVKGFGRRIPRVIDSSKRPKRTKQSPNDFDEINDEVNSLLAETLVPSLPSVPLCDKADEEEDSKNLLPEVGLAVDSNIPPQGNESFNTAMGVKQDSEICEGKESQVGNYDKKLNDKFQQGNGFLLEEQSLDGEDEMGREEEDKLQGREEEKVEDEGGENGEGGKTKYEDEREKITSNSGGEEQLEEGSKLEEDFGEPRSIASEENEPENEEGHVKLQKQGFKPSRGSDETISGGRGLHLRKSQEMDKKCEGSGDGGLVKDKDQRMQDEALSPQGTGQSTSGGDHNYVIGGAGSRKRKRSLLPIDRHDSEVDVVALPEELEGSSSVEEPPPFGNQSPRRSRTRALKSPKKFSSDVMFLPASHPPKSPTRSPKSTQTSLHGQKNASVSTSEGPKSTSVVLSSKSPKSPVIANPKSPKSPKSPPVLSPKSPRSPRSPPGWKSPASPPPVSGAESTPAASAPKSATISPSTSVGSRSPRSTQSVAVTKMSRSSLAKTGKSQVVKTQAAPSAKKPVVASEKDCPVVIKSPKNAPAYIVQSSKASPVTTQTQSAALFKSGQGTMKTIQVSVPSGSGGVTTTTTGGRKIMIVQNKAGAQSSGPQLISGGKKIIFLKGSGSNIILSPQQQKILAGGKVAAASPNKASTSIPNIVATPISSSELQGTKQLKIIKSTTKGQLPSNVLLNTAGGQILVPVSSVGALNPSASSSSIGSKSYILPVSGTGSGGKMILQSKVVLPALSKTSSKSQPIKLISGPGQQIKMASMVVPAQSPISGKSTRTKMIPKTIASPSGAAAMMPTAHTQIKPRFLQNTTKSPAKSKSGIVPNPLLKKTVPKVEVSVASPVVKKLSAPPVTHSPVSEVTTLHPSPTVVTSGVEQLLAGTGTQQLVAVPTEDGGQVMYLIGNNSLLGLDDSGQAVDGSGTTLFLDPASQSSLGNLILTFDNVNVSSAASVVPSGQDILAEALANTQVLQSEASVSGTDLGFLAPSNNTLFPSSVPTLSHGVLETSLTLNQPIMTPLEDLSAVSALQPPPAVSSALDLPITITQPDITISTSSYASLPIPSATIQSTVFPDSQHISSFSTSVPLLTAEADADGVFLDGETFISTESSSSASMPLLDAPE